MSDKLIDSKYTKWIANNLLYNYGLWDDNELFKESFYEKNNIKMNIDINNYAMCIFGINKKYNNPNNVENIQNKIDYFINWTNNLKEYANFNGISIDIILIKVDNSKQILMLLSENENHKISKYECAYNICKKEKDIESKLKNNLVKYFSCSYVENYSGYTDLNKAYKRCRELNDLIFFNIDDFMITENSIKQHNILENDNLFYSYCTKWSNLLYYGSLNDTLIHTDKIFNMIKESLSYDNFNYFIKFALNNIEILSKVYNKKLENFISLSNLDFFNINEYKEYTLNIIKELKSKLSKIYDSNVTLALYYIQNNYTHYDLGLNDIADYIGVSNTYISTDFKKEINMSLNQYIHYYRCEKSKELLIKTNYNLNDIAEKVGYIEYELYRKYFKKFNNTTPNDYRLTYKIKTTE